MTGAATATKTGDLLDAGVKDVALIPKDAAAGLTTMIERLAANPDVSVEKLERLMAMQERILAREAEDAFNAAFIEMQPKIPSILERGRTDKGKYAELEDIVGTVKPILHTHGFSLAHSTEWLDKKTLKVIGILTHRAGHSRRSEFMSEADASGSKNAIQGLGSAVAYGRRYTTKDLLLITTRGEDDDARKAGKPVAEEPEGYDLWRDGMFDMAEQGTAALQVAFQKSKREYREYITKNEPQVWARIKRKAGEVKI